MRILRKLPTTLIVVIALLWIVAGLFYPALFILLIVVLGPIAFYRKFINKETRTVGSRPYVPGRDCPTCGGWGQIDGHACTGICGGRKTR
jgi:hypothetical protein